MRATVDDDIRSTPFQQALNGYIDHTPALAHGLH